MMSVGAVIFPLAHAGHVIADAAIFGVPVGMIVGTILILRKWGPQDD
jgi:hypothetical protein